MAGQPFNSITELLEDLLGSHIDKETLAKTLTEVDQALVILKALRDQQAAILDGQGKIASDLLAIRAFLGVPDTEAVNQDQLRAIGDASYALAKGGADLAASIETAKPKPSE